MNGKLKYFLVCMCASTLLTACGGSSTSVQMSATTGMMAPEMSMDRAVMNEASAVSYEYDQSTRKSQTEQKLIRRVRVSLQLESNENLESSIDQLSALAPRSGGYVSNVSVDNRDSWANGNVTLRIPKDSVDTLLEDIRGLGIKVISVSDSSEDVTMQYTDTETRLEVKRTALKKYREYLEKAETVEELISIESKIDEIVADIESYEASLRVLNSQIDYTEVYVSVECKTSINRDSFWVRAGNKIKEIGYNIGDTILDGFEWMIVAIITIVFAAIPLFLIIKIVKFALKGKLKFRLPRREKKVTEQNEP